MSLILAIEAFRAAIATVLASRAVWAKLFLPASLGNPLECQAGLFAIVLITRSLSARCLDCSCPFFLEWRSRRFDRSFHLASSSLSMATIVGGLDGENSSKSDSPSALLLDIAAFVLVEALYKRVCALAYSSIRVYCWSKSSRKGREASGLLLPIVPTARPVMDVESLICSLILSISGIVGLVSSSRREEDVVMFLLESHATQERGAEKRCSKKPMMMFRKTNRVINADKVSPFPAITQEPFEAILVLIPFLIRVEDGRDVFVWDLMYIDK